MHDEDGKCSGLCGARLLNDGNCRFGTYGRQLEDIGGSMAKGYGGCSDGESDIENEVTPIKTKLLRKCQSSGSDTMLEILNSIVLYFIVKEYI